MASSGRLTDVLIRRGLAPSQNKTPIIPGETTVVPLRKFHSTMSTSPRLHPSFIGRSSSAQPVKAVEVQDEPVKETSRQAALEAFARDIREQNAAFERDSLLGIVDPQNMDAWQKRRRFS